MIVSPMTFVREGIRSVPAVKYALGVGAIAAIVAIVAGFQIDMRIALFGTVAVIALMFVLLVFARAATQVPAWLELPAKVATWSFILLIIAGAVLLTTSYFFAWPKSLRDPAGAATQQPVSETATAPQNQNPQAIKTPLGPEPAEPQEPRIDQPGPEVPDTRPATPPPVQGQCDAEYRVAMQEQLRRLIEAEIGRCATWTRDQIELHYSCALRDDVYRVRLVRQYSGGINGEVLRFEAEYGGPREFDVGRLRIRPLTPDYQRLCVEARRRRGY